jgi:5-methylcytosine-specific restriction endonuclease McrBC regulatory subunit McrC
VARQPVSPGTGVRGPRHARQSLQLQRALVGLKPSRDICLELQDHSSVVKSAVQFFGIKGGVDPQSQAARLADQFITQNRPLWELLDVSARRDYDGNEVRLLIRSGSSVGAVPLISPFSAKPDYGLVVQPRFPWPGIGPMLAEMGWLVSPIALRLPLLKRSERRVPPWVLSVMILARLKALLDKLERRFELIEQERLAPKGSVLWQQYATRNLPRAQFLTVPCRFHDLRDDRQLKGAIRFTIERQLQSLETQREQGAFVHRLIGLAESLLLRVSAVQPSRPSPRDIEIWLRRPLRSSIYLEGLQAIDWTIEERGLAGLSDWEGIPWTMPMEVFFEAWVETVLRAVVVRTGGRLRAGRKRETISPLIWEPPYLGSQRSLIPDLVLELEGCTFIVDAKYKRHWEELQQGPWSTLDDLLREEHRQDLLQILAYANLAETPSAVCCLIYPCSTATWESLRRRRRLFHRAEMRVRSRRIHVWLTAVPMCAAVERTAGPLVNEILNAIRTAC